jgi:hypothetical protein
LDDILGDFLQTHLVTLAETNAAKYNDRRGRKKRREIEMFGRYYNPPCMHFVEGQNVERQIVEIQIEYLQGYVHQNIDITKLN